MRYPAIILFLLITVASHAQPGKSLVIKVRAPKEPCTIYTEGDFFWQEKNNVVRIKTRAGTGKIQVVLDGGKITAQDGENYTLFFTVKNKAVITVYKFGKFGREMMLTKSYEVRGPVLWVCGIKTDSTSRVLKLNGPNLFAWSECFKKALPVNSFSMFFSEDTTTIRKPKPIQYKSDTCMLTADMRTKVLNYQPHYNYIYFYNIVYQVPDGTKRLADPIRFHAETDTTNTKTMSLWYSIYTMDK